MNEETRLDELLLRWDDLRRRGEDVAAEDLTAECPELTKELRRRIEAIKAMDWLDTAHGDGDDRTHLTGLVTGEGKVQLPDSSLSSDELLKQLSEAELMSTQELSRWLDDHPDPGLRADAKALALQLIQEGKLTPYQANVLLQGESKKLLIDKYLILDSLDAGGMGVVFKAIHRPMNRVVALKMLSPQLLNSPDKVQRFRREVQVAASLTHPNIVTAHDADESKGTHFLVMEHVEGMDLRNVVDVNGPLTVDQAVDCLLQAARGLAHAHKTGVIHRDIKPSNLMLSTDGVVKVLDLGLARMDEGLQLVEQELTTLFSKHDDDDTPADTREHLTHAGTLMGTVAFMAPEQALDTHNVNHRADIYSLGCTLYYLLVGEPPYRGEGPMQTVIGHREAPIPSLCGLRPDVPEELNSLFQRMLAKQPGDRPQSMREVIAALEAMEAVSPTSRPPARRTSAEEATVALEPGEMRNNKPSIRTPWAVSGIGVAAAGLVAAMILWNPLGPAKRSAKSRAERAAISEAATGGRVFADDLEQIASRWDQIAASLDQVAADDSQATRIRKDLVAYHMRHMGTERGREAAQLMRRMPWPADSLRAEDIPVTEIPAVAEPGSSQPPRELVAVFGESRAQFAAKVYGSAICVGRDSAAARYMSVCNNWASDRKSIWMEADAETGAVRRMKALRPQTRALSRDGQYAIAVRKDGFDYVAVPADETIRSVDLGYEPVVVSFDPSGRLAAAGARDGLISVCEMPEGPTVELRGHPAAQELRFSPDSSLLAAITRDRSVALWDLRTRSLRATVPDEESRSPEGLEAAISPDSRLIIATVRQGIGAWDTRRAEQKWLVTRQQLAGWPIGGLAFTPDGSYVVAADSVGNIFFIDTKDQQVVDRIHHRGSWTTELIVFPEAQELIAATYDGFTILDLATRRVIASQVAGPIVGLAVSADGEFVCGAGMGGCRIWEVSANKLHLRTGPKSYYANHPHFTTDQKGLFFRENSTVTAVNVDDGTDRWQVVDEALRARLAVSRNGRFWLTYGRQVTSTIWETTGREPVATLQSMSEGAECAAISDDGKRAATIDGSSQVRLYDAQTGKLLADISTNGSSFRGAAFSPDSRVLAVTSDRGVVERWNAKSGREMRDFKMDRGQLELPCFSPDGRWLSVIEGTTGQLLLLNAENGTLDRSIQIGPVGCSVESVTFAPDSRHLFVGRHNGTVCVLRLDKWRQETP